MAVAVEASMEITILEDTVARIAITVLWNRARLAQSGTLLDRERF